MAVVYFKLILAERRTIEQVPEIIRADVQRLLDEYYAGLAN